MKKSLIITTLILLVLSCKTTQVKDESLSNSLLGVVYDNKSNPIQGSQLIFKQVDSKFELRVSSDIDGKFFIPELEFGSYILNISAKNCTPTTLNIDHFDIENVLIIKISTFEDIITELKENIVTKDLTLAKANIDKLEDINPKDVYFSYLKSIYYIEGDDYINSEKILLNLISRTNNDPYVNLLLADLYQYHIKDNNKAIKYLTYFLNKEYTEKETLRLKELKSAL